MKTSYALELEGITKTYGSIRANDSIDLRIRKSSIHAIVGENGAGKSTVMKTVFGLVRPDAGKIKVFGKPRVIDSPKSAMALGIGMVHQHFMLSDRHSVLDNLLLGSETIASQQRSISSLKPIPRNEIRHKLQALIDRLEFEIPLDELVENLSVGVQQRIEIVKVLKDDPKILIFDEPTAVLAPTEVESFYGLLGELRDAGKTVIVITHKIGEVVKYADHVSVLRGGRHIHSTAVEQTNESQIAKWMVGEFDTSLEERRGVPHQKEIISWRSEALPLRVQSQEIVGVVGVEGNGQDELIDCILYPKESQQKFDVNEIKWLGVETTHLSRRSGISLIAQDRHEQGVFLEKTLSENFLLGNERSKTFFINWKKVKRSVAALLEKFSVYPKDVDAKMGSLSGGNQQKFVVARETSSNPKLLIAAQPTRGVDLGAAAFIHRELCRVRDSGAGVLLVTSDLDEALKLSDRLLVIYRNKFIGEFRRENFDRQSIGLKMGGIAS